MDDTFNSEDHERAAQAIINHRNEAKIYSRQLKEPLRPSRNTVLPGNGVSPQIYMSTSSKTVLSFRPRSTRRITKEQHRLFQSPKRGKIYTASETRHWGYYLHLSRPGHWVYLPQYFHKRLSADHFCCCDYNVIFATFSSCKPPQGGNLHSVTPPTK